MSIGWKPQCRHSKAYKIYHNGEYVCGICLNYKCQELERMVYECVSLSDVMRSGLSEELYNHVTSKFENEETQ